jgi:mannosyltransferase OCH1-like enzyme
VLIPRIFHQIWVGPDPLPEEFAAYRQTWLDHHPGWELRLWTEETLPADPRRPEGMELLRHPSERSDILRFDLLSRFGGVYLDCDFECLRPIDGLLEGVQAFAGYRKPGYVNNALIGAAPGHPFDERALVEIRPRTTWGTVDKDGTGPLFVDRVVAEFPDVKLFDPPVFYPRTAAQREAAYAVHHPARSWKDAEGLRESLDKSERRRKSAQEEARQWRLRAERAEAELARVRDDSRVARAFRRLARG